MAHDRNTQGLKANALKKKNDAIKRTELAIQKMLKENITINFKTVAEKAKVSTAWLYREPEIADRIKKIRAMNNSKNNNKLVLEKTSDTSKDALIATLKARIKELELSNLEQKKTIEMLYGKLHDCS
ncbi:DUF6262 family protein [Acinetobacter johnsonii]|jgi:hypothetical protein|uniref:DUF6262 family protein n=1 Tax=Acinetobacter johnsonii TaxID=40214 RepID=UPI00191D6A8F|nr:DUF6262 family protein [Acinetobacter johnsonii]QQV09994.1 hypothetical protein I6I49_04320 [Acinetobacter johnsonii]QQV10543.1 hypothetical protein I6I49_07615 [Acinetobacter johnsonii]